MMNIGLMNFQHTRQYNPGRCPIMSSTSSQNFSNPKTSVLVVVKKQTNKNKQTKIAYFTVKPRHGYTLE